VKRDLVAAQHRLAAAVEAADPRLRAAEKAAARDAQVLALAQAETDAQRGEAIRTWARAIDRINRAARLTARAVSRAKAEVARTEDALHRAEQAEQTARIAAEAADAACLDARARLAACEESLMQAGHSGPPTSDEPHRATGGHAVMIGQADDGQPLVIEAMVSGDREAVEGAALSLAEEGSFTLAEAQLQLQELTEAIVSAAAEQGYLLFDSRNPFWTQLSMEEAHDVVAALARLGFHYEPAEGWQGGQSPQPTDLSMALAYAGLDARNMRGLPSAEDLRQLPLSIGVDARAFLASVAPDLAVDRLVPVLDRRAERLAALWNAWGHVRPVLLSERRSLGSIAGSEASESRL